MSKKSAIWLMVALVTALGPSCESSSRDVTDGDDDAAGCTTTSCYAQCEDEGFTGGLCDESGTCVCDGDTDTGSTDADSDADTDTGGTGSGGKCDVDIIFVYDTSGSMMDAVGPLTSEAFPAFADALATYPSLGTVHVGVTTNLFGEHDFENGGSGFSCDGGTEVTVQTSDLLTKGWDTGEPHDPNCCEEVPDVDCAFASGEKWIEGPSSTMLDEFACVGNVPCQQDIMAGEPTLEAGLKSLQYEGNAGFIRDEALLVVVFITDEEDQSSMTASSIKDGLLALKNDDPTYLAVVTIAGPKVGTEIVNDVTNKKGCFGSYGGTEQTPEIIAFTEQFGDRGIHFEMCGDNDMSGALSAAFDVLELSCEEIIIE